MSDSGTAVRKLLCRWNWKIIRSTIFRIFMSLLQHFWTKTCKWQKSNIKHFHRLLKLIFKHYVKHHLVLQMPLEARVRLISVAVSELLALATTAQHAEVVRKAGRRFMSSAHRHQNDTVCFERFCHLVTFAEAGCERWRWMEEDKFVVWVGSSWRSYEE